MHTQVRLAPPKSRLAASFSKVFAPAVVLLVVIVLAGVNAGLGFLGVVALAVGIIVVPGFTYKKYSLVSEKLGLPATWRTGVVTILTVVGVIACALLNVPALVSATVVGLVAGNAGLALARRWLNASAHVSVISFAALWGTAVFGPPLGWLLVLSPMMMVSRTALKEHTWGQALAGALIGIVTFGCFVGAINWSWIT